MPIGKRIGAEFLGTMVLIIGGVGAQVLGSRTPFSSNMPLVVSLAFGFTMAAMAYALSNVSGAHFNPAVTLGLYVSKRFPKKDVLPYMVAQLSGAILGASALYLIARGRPDFSASAGFFANGFEDLSPGRYSLTSVMVSEVLLTFIFVLVIAMTIDRRSLTPVFPLIAGIALAMVHFVGIPIDGGSFSPVRSVATAMVQGGRSIYQIWLFILAPLIGGSLAGAAVPLLSRTPIPESFH